jgi:hypothetical protein
MAPSFGINTATPVTLLHAVDGEPGGAVDRAWWVRVPHCVGVRRFGHRSVLNERSFSVYGTHHLCVSRRGNGVWKWGLISTAVRRWIYTVPVPTRPLTTVVPAATVERTVLVLPKGRAVGRPRRADRRGRWPVGLAAFATLGMALCAVWVIGLSVAGPGESASPESETLLQKLKPVVGSSRPSYLSPAGDRVEA